MNFEQIKNLADRMIDADRERNKAFSYYQRMYHNEWSLPTELQSLEYIHKATSTGPHDAIAAGTRVLSSIHPKPHIIPPLPTPEQKSKANRDEQNLLWHLMTADRRRGRSVVQDVVQSALLYDAVAISIIDLDWQIKQAKALNASTRRMEAARRVCRFVINVYNPADVHVRRSSYGVESVLLCQKRPAYDVMAEWGDIGKQLSSLSDSNEVVEYYDYIDYDKRAVWICHEQGDDIVLLKPVDHELDFLPWSAVMGDSSLEGEEKHKYHPMLYPIYQSGSWETMNILHTMLATDAIIKMWKPPFAEAGPNPDTGSVDYTDPTMVYKPATGNAIQAIPQQTLDPAKMQMIDQLRQEMQQSTISSILLGGGVPSGTAFASLNLLTQTAVGALKPPKELAEKALAEMFILMLMWTKNGDTPLVAHGMEVKGDLGRTYTILPTEVNERDLYLEVKLEADVPTDRMQRANVAGTMIQWGYPVEYALEELGVEDPERAINLWYLEKLKAHKFNLALQAESMQMQTALQMQAQEQAQGMAQEQQQAQAAQMQQMQQAQMMSQQLSQAGPQAGAQGFNPAMGGNPSAMAMPEETREMLGGEDMMGNPMGGGL